MRTKNLLKLAFTMLAMFIMTGAMAQNTVTVYLFNGDDAAAPSLYAASDVTFGSPLGSTVDNVITYTFAAGDYVVVDGTQKNTFTWAAGDVTIRLKPATIAINYVEATEATYQTFGNSLTLYALPDPAYSPDYAGSGTTAGINTASRWVWSLNNDMSTPFKADDNNENWVVISGLTDAMTSRIYYVQENVGTTGCTGSIVPHTVNVVLEPEITTFAQTAFETAANWTSIGTNKWSTCEAAPGTATLTSTFQELHNGLALPAGLRKFTYGVTLTQTDYDINGAVLSTSTTTPVVPALTDIVSTEADALTKDYTPTLTRGANQRVFEYSITPTSVGSYISRISQYRNNSAAAYTYYDNVPATVLTFVLNLPPVTGPIYHIPNNFVF